VFRRYEPQGYDKRGRHIIDLVPLNPNYPTLRIDACNPGSHRGEGRPVFALSRLVLIFRSFPSALMRLVPSMDRP
jgi:hypothetical protein